MPECEITVIRDGSKTMHRKQVFPENFFFVTAAAIETESLPLYGIGCTIVNAHQIEFLCKLEAFL